MEIYEVRDPVYGFIKFNEWEKEIIDHPVFQRLRNIKQQGLTHYIYPGAVHTRFEHSLGVMHYATQMFDSVTSKDENRNILEEQFLYKREGLEKIKHTIRIAALLHDIGHAPFSHSSEELMPVNKDSGRRLKHEDYTIKIIHDHFKDVIENNDCNKNNFNISVKDISGILSGSFEGPIFWKLLLSSQLDADRGDYLLRDSHHIGVKYGIYDHSRLINTMGLGFHPETDDIFLAIEDDGWHTAEALLIARYKIFTQVNHHKTRRAYDYHLHGAMKSILSDGLLPDLDNIDEYLKLDDMICFNRFRENVVNNEDCRVIVERKNHIRMYEEASKEEEIEKIDKLKIKLDNHNIWYYEDIVKEDWYNTDQEIMIVPTGGRMYNSNRKVKRLSDYSSIVGNFRGIKQVRIYTKERDRDKARELRDA